MPLTIGREVYDGIGAFNAGIRSNGANTLVLYGLALHRVRWDNRDCPHPAADRRIPWQHQSIALVGPSLAGVVAVPLYWVHQFEEYSLPVLGFDRSIQEMICKNLSFSPYPDCPIPLSFYPLVNIALMWFGAPLAGYLADAMSSSVSAFGDCF